MNKKHTVTIEKLVFGGQGLAHLEDGRIVFVWNALPGERVEIEIVKKKKDYLEAIATNILEPSPDRIEPTEGAFLSTSPWQILSQEKEAFYKRSIAAETYSKIGDLILSESNLEIATDGAHEGYRNKMEFSFVEQDDGTISLAFFQRGGKKRFAVDGSVLASPVINEVAQYILSWVREKQIPIRSLKSLIIRSTQTGDTLAALFIKDELEFDSFPELTESLKGFQLYYSTHKSPASVPTKLLYSDGQDYLVENILGTQLKFGALSFFQVNIPMFERALKDIAAFLHPKMPLVDYYCGVGAIGLPLSKNRDECLLVDNNEEAIVYAQDNIAMNALLNCHVQCTPAEKITDLITAEKMIVVDPPRAGLHEKMIHRLLLRRPPRIIYLSCNLSTQARDIRLLSQGYKLSFMKLYNFFPRTPHIEGLCVLDSI